MKVTTLTENLTYDRALLAEHGLSFFLESPKQKILFDTGQSDIFIRNANVLNIDLNKADSLIISHGHYDHTGGIKHFLEINSKAKIYIKQEAFNKKYSKFRESGIPYSHEIPEERIIYTNETTQLEEGLFIISNILPENILYEKDNPGMYVETGGVKYKDNFADEQYLVTMNDNGISIITGCSHLGIVNILNDAVNRFGLPLNYLVGGLHTSNSPENEIKLIIKQLEYYNPKGIALSHCTGIDVYCRLKKIFPEKVFYNHTGKKFEL